ncbi:MAG: bifunctional enoyl-CoA hydratase/phosphate acetyltransferase [Rhodospirillales bacterium]
MLSTTPFEIPSSLLDAARKLPAIRVAVAGADHPVPMESARAATINGIIEPILIGDKSRILRISKEISWELGGHTILNTGSETETAETAARIASEGRVKAIMKGQVHTDVLMRTVLSKSWGLRTGRRMTHVFYISFPGSSDPILISDCAVNVRPDEQTLRDIVMNTLELSRTLSIRAPKIALISGTESVIESVPSSILAHKVTIWGRDQVRPSEHIDGPMGLDVAVSQSAACTKGIGGDVAGKANILIAPNMEAGNVLFKSLVYFRSALPAGLLLGAKVPIVLTSRADPPQARLAAAVIAQIHATAANALSP